MSLSLSDQVSVSGWGLSPDSHPSPRQRPLFLQYWSLSLLSRAQHLAPAAESSHWLRAASGSAAIGRQSRAHKIGQEWSECSYNNHLPWVMQTGEIVMVEWSNTTINYQFNQQILDFIFVSLILFSFISPRKVCGGCQNGRSQECDSLSQPGLGTPTT